MSIYLGTNKLKKCYIGTTKVKKIYLGTTMVWQGVVLVNKPTSTTVVRNYNGSAQNNGYTCPTGVSMSGTASATNGGIYTATYTPQEGFAWADDGTQTPVTVTMTIQYVWVKWNVLTNYAESISETKKILPGANQLLETGTFTYAHVRKVDRTYSFDSTSGKYIFTSDAQYDSSNSHFMGGAYGKIGFADGTDRGENISVSSSKIYYFESGAGWIIRKSGTEIRTSLGSGSMSSGAYHTCESVVSGYSKGSTNYGNVTSTSSSAYPENGKSGDYWYVKSW